MWTYNGKHIREGRAWTNDDGVQHPANWHIWSEDEKIAQGLVWTAPQVQPDERFYWFSQNADGTYESTPKDLNDLKTHWISQTKRTQGGFLSKTDWAYIRLQDTAVAVPSDIQTYRNDVRSAATTIENSINACSTLEAFKALFVSPTDADGNITGNAPMYDWPEEI
jgi:hypothetical protein